MQLLLIILKPVLQSAAISFLIGIIKSKLGSKNENKKPLSLANFKPLLILAIGVTAGVLLTWNFKPSQIEVVEKFIDREKIIEVMPPLNCPEVELLTGIKKGESIKKLIRPYAELKAAYLGCRLSITQHQGDASAP